MKRLSWLYIKEKWNHAGFQRYFRNTGWLFFARFFLLAVGFFINAYIARHLGPANFGLMNYVFSFVGLFGFLASLGIDSVANREIVLDHGKRDVIVGTSFYLKLFGSIIATLAVMVTAYFTTNDATLFGLIIMYSLTFIIGAFGVTDIYFQSQVLSKYTAIATIIASVISTLFKVAVVMFGAGIIWLVAIYVFESGLLTFISLSFFIKKSQSVKNWTFEKAIAISLMKDSWPLIVSSVAWSIYMKIDQVMIKNMLGNQETGVYAVAVKLAEFWYFIPGLICSSVFPAIINAKKTSIEIYENRLTKLYSLMFYMSLGIGLFTSILAPQIISLLFGYQYIGATSSLRIYIWAGIAVSIGSTLYNYLIAENLTKANAVAMTSGAIINVILNIFLIPLYGIAGAAFASFISYTAVTIVNLSFRRMRSQFKLIARSIIFNW